MLSSTLFADHVQRPRNCGPLLVSNRVGRFGTEGGGPYMTFWLLLNGDVIENVAFQTYGCPSAIACGSMTTELVKGRTIEQALRLEPEDLMTVLGGLPEGKEDCARMSIAALRDALGEKQDAL